MAALVAISPDDIPAVRGEDDMAHRRAAWSKGIMDDFVASGESAAEVTQGVDGKPFATPRDVVRHATMLRNHYNKPEYRGVRVMQRRNRLFVVKEDKK